MTAMISINYSFCHAVKLNYP